MDIKQLESELKKIDINPTYYSLTGELLPNRYILSRDHGYWSTFLYDERGRVLNKQDFNTKSEACQNILKLCILEKEFHAKYDLK